MFGEFAELQNGAKYVKFKCLCTDCSMGISICSWLVALARRRDGKERQSLIVTDTKGWWLPGGTGV